MRMEGLCLPPKHRLTRRHAPPAFPRLYASSRLPQATRDDNIPATHSVNTAAMVLEEAFQSDSPPSTEAAFSSSDSTPFPASDLSSDDPILRRPGHWIRIDQNLNNVPQAPLYVNLANCPKPIFSSFRPKNMEANAIRQQIDYAANVLQRPLTQEEADALAYHYMRAVRLAGYGTPVGAGIAGLWAARGRKEYTFPGWQPFKEGSKLSPDSLGPLRGFSARVAWQSLRFSAFFAVGTVLGGIFFGSYAMTSSLAGRAMDPRLKNFMDELKVRGRQRQGEIAKKRVEDQTPGKRPDGMETYEMARQRRGVQGMGREAQDDASPTGGMYGQEYGWQDQPGFLSEEEVRRLADERAEQAENASKRDAAQSSRASRETQNGAAGPGSAWDRLRQDAMASSQKRTATKGSATPEAAGSRSPVQDNRDTTVGDSFNFSSSDAEREYARSEAQRDFDKRLEQERQGKSFDDGSSGRRW